MRLPGVRVRPSLKFAELHSSVCTRGFGKDRRRRNGPTASPAQGYIIYTFSTPHVSPVGLGFARRLLALLALHCASTCSLSTSNCTLSAAGITDDPRDPDKRHHSRGGHRPMAAGCVQEREAPPSVLAAVFARGSSYVELAALSLCNPLKEDACALSPSNN